MHALVDLDVAYTTPLDAEALWDYLAARVIAGVEECDPLTYRRAVHLPGGPGVLVLRRSGDQVRAGAVLSAAADAGAELGRASCRERGQVGEAAAAGKEKPGISN